MAVTAVATARPRIAFQVRALLADPLDQATFDDLERCVIYPSLGETLSLDAGGHELLLTAPVTGRPHELADHIARLEQTLAVLDVRALTITGRKALA